MNIEGFVHVYVYSVTFGDGRGFKAGDIGPQNGRMILLPFEDVCDDDEEEIDTTALDYEIMRKLRGIFDKPIAKFSYQIVTALDEGVDVKF